MSNNSSTWQRQLCRFADSSLGIIHHLWIIHSACLGEHTTENKCGIFFPFQWSPFLPLLPSLTGQQRAGAPVAVERILQVIEFSAKAPWIIKHVVGEPAQVSRLIQITMCIQTDGSVYVSTRTLTRTLFCVKYTHAHKHTNTNILPSIARLLAMQLCGRLSHTIIWLYGPAPSLTICCTINCGFKTT